MLLSIDTSTPQIGLALYNGAQVLAESLWVSKARHTVELAPALNDILLRTGIRIDEIKAIGVALGPGSFTALRVGLSFVKGLALARRMEVAGINTLDIMAASQLPQRTGILLAEPHDIPLLCALPAGRGRMALRTYHLKNQEWQAVGPAEISTAVGLVEKITSKAILCGDFNAAELGLLKKNPHIYLVSPALSVRRPAVLAELAYKRWQAGDVDDISALAPIYLHIAEPVPDISAGITPA